TDEERQVAIEAIEVITGYWKSRAVSCAASLNIADYVTEKPVSIDVLAEKTGANSHALHRLMRALASIGFFKEVGERHFSITPLAATLKTNAKNSVKYTAISFGHDEYPGWITLEETIKTGKSGFLQKYGIGYYDSLKDKPVEFENFVHMCEDYTRLFNMNMTSYYDFTQFKHIIDCAGNNGEFLINILEHVPHAKGTVFDEAHAIEAAKKRVAQSSVKDRMSFEAGSFLDSVPAGGDCYMIKSAVVDWLDDAAVKIFHNVKKHLKPGNRFLVIQSVIPSGNEYHPGKWTDLLYQVFTTGIERTRKETEELCRKAGMKLVKIIPTDYPLFDIIEMTV
ncbi:hypothetical protein B4U80_12106, partial [Leptotrombidium deliense]